MFKKPILRSQKLCIQINGLAIDASTSGFVDGIFMERLDTRALSTFIDPPKILKRYVDDNFCKLKEIRVEAFLIHLNLQHPIIKFRIKIFESKVLAYLNVCCNLESDGAIRIIIPKKLHTDQFLNFKSSHHIK